MPWRDCLTKELAWTVLILTLALIGCRGQGPGSGEDGISGPVPPVFREPAFEEPVFYEKVYLNEASFEQVAAHVSICRGKKACVSICHRPPGNPGNAKNLLLPLQATPAHLRHGGPHHARDYLGDCVIGEDETEAEEEPVEEEPPQEEVPLWCQEVYHLDSDCDGFDDDTGELLFGEF